MFTGIVEELGTIAAIEDQGDAIRLTIASDLTLSDAGLGDSIAVNGCCLTVAERTDTTWTADVMAETLAKTSIGGLVVGEQVNLERAVTAEKRLGGHIVQGHVDAVGEVVARTPSEHWEVVEIAIPAEFGHFLVDKGSITVDGTSLTVVEVSTGSTTGQETFTVSLIPETLARTTLGFRVPGSKVNLEVDVIAKYVAKNMESFVRAYAAPEAPAATKEN